MSVDLTALDAYLGGTESRITAVVATFSELIANRARELCRYDDSPDRPDGPHLRDTITAHLAGWAAEITAGEGLPDARAVYNEYGTTHMAAQPFIRPAVEQYATAFEAAVQIVMSGG